jgi:Domain of unknown function (DUF4190)
MQEQPAGQAEAQPPLPPQPEPQPLQTQTPVAVVGFSAQTNSLAIVSLVSGIISWFMVPVIGGIVAVVTGHMAKSQIRRTGEQGGIFATVGLVLGYLHLAVVLLIALLVALFLVGTFSAIRATTSG